MKVGILTISDKGSQGLRMDTSGPALSNWLIERNVETVSYEIVPDEEDAIVAKLINRADSSNMDFILTTRCYRTLTTRGNSRSNYSNY
jgi:molybdopterin biosynthesis enzyme MoaB